MSNVTLNAHVNGQQIVLDEAFDLPENAKLLVTILEIPDLGRESKLDLINILKHVLVAKPPFAKPANIMGGIPFELATVRPSGFPHSLYEELWHLNYWLHFSLALIRGENPDIPKHSLEGFPVDNDHLSESVWQALLKQVGEGLEMVSSLAHNKSELSRVFLPERTVEGELIVVASHNAYHFGRMVTLRQILGIWSSDLGESW